MNLARLTTEELAAVVGTALEASGFTAVLTGGSCVTIHATGKYVSLDLDFVIAPQDRAAEADAALRKLGFRRTGRVYTHPQTRLAVDISNPWPLAVGCQVLPPPRARRVAGRRLRLLSPTDCVKDRLASFYFWNDRQALEQAILVCLARRVRLVEVELWSRREGMIEKFRQFREELAVRRGKRRRK